MNEPDAAAPPVEPAPFPLPYKDRSAGLTVFGILTLLMGCLAALFVPLVLLGQAAAAKSTNAASSSLTIVPVIAVYGILAVVLVWLGIGSMLARRWARALLLIFSWSWLVMGLFAVVFMAFFMPTMLSATPSRSTAGQPAMPPGAMAAMMVVMFLVLGVLFVVLPAIWVFFYRSRHVKATCEARDPVPRWTDACPLPVLALCLWCLFSVAMLLLMPLVGRGVMPFFGMFLSGLPGTLFCLGAAAVWSLAAWWLYKLDGRGWWLILIALCVFMASALLTYARHDTLEMYRLMGYPEAQIEQMQKTGLLTGNRMSWLMSFSMLPFLGYILFVRKHLRAGTKSGENRF